MEEKHNDTKTLECNICGKKHVNIHEKKTRRCKFFLNREGCPISDIGWKFVHDENEHAEIETIEGESH